MEKKEETKKSECFVIMPISDQDGYPQGHFRRVYDDIISPAIKESGFVPQRGDDVTQTNLIHLDILKRLLEAPIALCDLSARNPNVLFELGIRQAFDKPVVLIREKGTPDIFDIGPLRYCEYDREMRYRDVLQAQKDIAAAIISTKDAEKDSTNVNSIVKLLSINTPASIPKLDRSNKESLSLDILSSQIAELRRILEMTLKDQRNSLRAGQAIMAYEYERLSRMLDRIREGIESGSVDPKESMSHLRDMRDEVMRSRMHLQEPREIEAFMMLEDRISRMMNRLSK